MKDFEKYMFEINKSIKDKIKNRQKDNKAIIEIINDYVEKYPELRFGQILYVLGMIRQDENGNCNLSDIFNEEPIDTLIRIENSL